ncbi:FecCD family ABC transporter permease [Anaerovorax odorimutans]|uniref:FecCD family ABC transporter permease n=1 Tax=Anaerovorax odorimutans TaxID=109327 RepID=UPI0004224DC7|nr:iron ABC transporter permease [Anaerovorax odorimutans]
MISIVKKYKLILIFVFIPILIFIFSLTFGRYFIKISDLINLMAIRLNNKPLGDYEVINTVIFNMRLPRIIAALLIGGALSVSGTVYQSIFKNPMVSPGILGVSNGAGFGAAVGILLSFGSIGVQFTSFIFGICAVMITYLLSSALSKKIGDSILMLILSGMVIGTIFSSLISLTKYVADPDDALPAITFWLMGSLTSITMKDNLIISIPIILGTLPLVMFRNKLNILAFGDEEAQALGENTERVRLLFIICSTLITSAAISVSGIIGWVGLIIPHITRIIIGPNNNLLIPTSIAIGASYLMIVDDVARTICSIEIPLGILTSLIGAPFFLYLLFHKKGV